MTRFGRIARGPRRELLPEAGWRAARAWGLATVVDLRCPYETGRRDGDPEVPDAVLDQVTLVAAPLEDHDDAEFREVCFPILDSPAYWPHHLRILPGLVAATLTAIADAAPGVLVHCSAGRDRTGLVSALLLANAGVPPETVWADYAASVRAMAGVATHAPTLDPQAGWGDAEVERRVREARPLVEEVVADAPAHLDAIGLDRSVRDRLRALLLE